jgi:hypothetical protein
MTAQPAMVQRANLFQRYLSATKLSRNQRVGPDLQQKSRLDSGGSCQGCALSWVG